MAENNVYLAIGEEATRGTAESTTVGFVPLLAPGNPQMAFEDKKREEFRGEDTVKGDTAIIRMGQKWSASLSMPFFTEAGSAKGIVGSLFKHFFGKTTSAQNGATGQYRHMLYPVADPFSSSNLDTKALTLNHNMPEGTVIKNHAYRGGRVKSLSFEQSPGSHLQMGVEMMGQLKTATGTAIASPTFAAENLRCDYNNLTMYTGTITRTGTGPDYTAFTFGSATAIKPDKISLKIDNGMEDVTRLSGLDYPDKTRMGRFQVTLDMTIDWEDPSSGFSSVDDVNAWLAATGSTNFFLHWDTGTQAGTGDNHALYIDLPIMQRMGGTPDLSRDKDPMVTLKYEGLYDATTTKYIMGVFLKNTASAI